MHDVMRKRIMRTLETLPDEQLYQVVDFMEYLEAKYAREVSREPSSLQRFAERVEDQMRMRSVAPKAVRGTMKIMSTATRVMEGLTEVGRSLVEPAPHREDRGVGETATDGEADAVAGAARPPDGGTGESSGGEAEVADPGEEAREVDGGSGG